MQRSPHSPRWPGPQAQHRPETTFRHYSSSQANTYASRRPDYPAALYQYILDEHLGSPSTSGSTGTSKSTVASSIPSPSPSPSPNNKLELLLDLGTGHGNVLRALAPHFQTAIGADPSKGMLELAQTLTEEKGVRTRNGGALRFVHGNAEAMQRIKGVDVDVSEEGGGNVDLIVAGTAAHWFDMPLFWASAATVLKPGGTVALWTAATMHPHPLQPQAADLQKLFEYFESEVLGPFMLPGNRCVRVGYETLLLPFELDLPEGHKGRDVFPESGFRRRDWNRRGECGDGEEFLQGMDGITPEGLGRVYETISPVTRWRADEGNRQKVARGEITDCVEGFVEEMERIVGKGAEMRLGVWIALLMFKKAGGP